MVPRALDPRHRSRQGDRWRASERKRKKSLMPARRLAYDGCKPDAPRLS
jgi:hypothetical protein